MRATIKNLIAASAMGQSAYDYRHQYNQEILVEEHGKLKLAKIVLKAFDLDIIDSYEVEAINEWLDHPDLFWIGLSRETKF